MHRPVALLTLLVLAQPLLAPAAEEDPKVRAKILQGDYLEGKLTDITPGDDETTFTVVVTKKSSVINKATETKIADLTKKIAAEGGKKLNAAQLQNLQKMNQDLATLKANLYEQVDVPYEFSLKAGKNLVVRRQKLPPKVDGDGKPAKYTPEELKQLRGDNPRLEGYTAETKDLEKDSLVRVWLDRKNVKVPPPPDPKKKDKEDAGPATMILLLPAPEEKKPKDPPAKKDK